MWSLLVPQLLDHLENVKMITFRRCVSKSATMVLPLFGFYFNQKEALSCWCSVDTRSNMFSGGEQGPECGDAWWWLGAEELCSGI